jgi:NAD-dependent dihydropyrimidine dehydrogenase PreA subunit
MKTKMKSLKSIIFAVIISATSIAILDSCEVLDDVLYAVNEPKCTGCKKCLSVCPQDAISIVDGKAVIDKEECIGCGRCLRVCSEKAIYVIPKSE